MSNAEIEKLRSRTMKVNQNCAQQLEISLVNLMLMMEHIKYNSEIGKVIHFI